MLSCKNVDNDTEQRSIYVYMMKSNKRANIIIMHMLLLWLSATTVHADIDAEVLYGSITLLSICAHYTGERALVNWLNGKFFN
jgi:hypothetical protein